VTSYLEFFLHLPVDVDNGPERLLHGVDPALVDADLGKDGREAKVGIMVGTQRDLQQ
jgi:hypothetical protein